MEEKLLKLYLEFRKNHTQIVSFVSGGMAIILAATLTASADKISKGYIFAGLSIVSLIIVFIHKAAHSEYKTIITALSQANSNLVPATEKIIQIVWLSALCFVIAAIICAVLAFKYLTLN